MQTVQILGKINFKRMRKTFAKQKFRRVKMTFWISEENMYFQYFILI